jgi:hypothetical protein
VEDRAAKEILSLVSLSFLLSFLSLSLFRNKEEDGKTMVIMQEDVRECKGNQLFS